MNRSFAALAVATALALAGCSSKSDPSEANFKTALDAYFAKKGDVCLDFYGWPQEITPADNVIGGDRPNSDVAQMKALESVGLVSAREIEKPTAPLGLRAPRTRTVTHYELTAAGKAALRRPGSNSSAMSSGKADLCYGRKAVDTIVTWDAPISLGEFKGTTVTYTYKLEDLAPWANDDRIKRAFPDLVRTLEGAGNTQDKHGVQLTNLGWEANGLD